MSKKRGRTTKTFDDDDASSPKSKKKKYERKQTKMFVDEVENSEKVSKSEMLNQTLQKQKVKDLRDELTKRGLSKQGRKSDLIERLVVAMVEEDEKNREDAAQRKKLEKEEEEQKRKQEERVEEEEKARREKEEEEEKRRREKEEKTKQVFGDDDEDDDDVQINDESVSTTTTDPKIKRRKRSRWGDNMGDNTSDNTNGTSSTEKETTTKTTTTTTTTTIPKKDIPRNDAQNHDVNFWSALLQDASRLTISDAEEKYERVLKKYPSHAMYWRVYADHCLREGDFDRVASIFRRALPLCRQVELYVLYIQFIKSKPLEGVEEMDEHEKRTKRRDTIEKAYEFSLKRVGQSLYSYPLWNSYFDFLEAEDSASIGSMNEQFVRSSRLIKTRRWYQSAVGSPFRGVEKIWERYVDFEKSTGSGVTNLGKVEPKHKTARHALGKKEGMWNGVSKDALPQPPDGSNKEKQQIVNWIDIINYEKRNPLHRSPSEHREDVRLVYHQCLSVMRYHVKIWHDFVDYERSVCVSETEGNKIASEIYRQAFNTLTDSVILGLALAGIEELRKVSDGDEDADPKAVFEQLWKNAPCALVFVEYQRMERRLSGVKAARLVFRRARKHERCTWQVFASAARLEFHSNNEIDAARNIFELGMKQYSNVADYVLAYADLLNCFNDNNNLRALFERSIPVFMESGERKDAMRIWDRYVRFEAQNCRNGGNVKTVARVMRRWKEAMPEEDGLKTLRASTYKYRFHGLGKEYDSDVDKFYMSHSTVLSFE